CVARRSSEKVSCFEAAYPVRPAHHEISIPLPAFGTAQQPLLAGHCRRRIGAARHAAAALLPRAGTLRMDRAGGESSVSLFTANSAANAALQLNGEQNKSGGVW